MHLGDPVWPTQPSGDDDTIDTFSKRGGRFQRTSGGFSARTGSLSLGARDSLVALEIFGGSTGTAGGATGSSPPSSPGGHTTVPPGK